MRTAAMIMAGVVLMAAGDAAAQRTARADQRADDPFYRLDDRVYAGPDERGPARLAEPASGYAPARPQTLPPRPIRRDLARGDRWVSEDGSTVVTTRGGAYLRTGYDAGGTTIMVESAPVTTTTTTTTEIVRDEVTYRAPARKIYRKRAARPRSKPRCRCDS